MGFRGEYIYALENTVTKRVYVGRTGRRPEWRYKDHISLLEHHRHKNKLMQMDFDKYGMESFRIRVLQRTDNYFERHTEGKWMVKLKTYDPKRGYNYQDPYFVHAGKYTKNIPHEYLINLIAPPDDESIQRSGETY